MDLDELYPSLDDIKRRAKRRLPHFAWEYLDSATGREEEKKRNRGGLDEILFHTNILRGEFTADLTTRFLDRDYALPVGIAPIGMSGMIWPGAEAMLAQAAVSANIPFCLSTVATVTPETLTRDIGDNGWFQLYPAADPDIRRDIIKRAKDAGFHTLVMTADVPVASRRERQKRAQLTMPPRITPRMLWESATHPMWAMGILKTGIPRLRLAESYLKLEGKVSSTQHAGYVIRGMPDWEYLDALRSEWDGPMIIKGVTRAEDAAQLVQTGIDAIWVSNHAGRQFDGGRASIDCLPEIRAVVGDAFPLIFDSGIESGLDVLRAIAMGADFVMLGRAFHYATAAFGSKGAAHMIHILQDEMASCLGQIGVATPQKAIDHVIAIKT